MTSRRVASLVAVSWFYSLLICAVMIVLTVSLQLCGNIVNTVYCGNYSIVKLACSDITVINIYGLFVSLCTLFVPLILILYTYIKILRVCFSGCKQSRQKALSTCTPHFVSLINFSFGCSFEILQSRFDMSGVPTMFRILLSLYFLTCQPLLNAVMYGLTFSKIRVVVRNVVSEVGL
ncbi:Olfactory receptor 52D1 [Dissostichus eleginoides]|uniref:Olfactory receptor 52D1 n=1 Tax=Dissostichus eleginoides TaxID=100907 RepID=A0AAD9FF09_DISEL|nr:Olfactory receptor 52D1 [Dissostichus eleginoides]